MHGQAGKALFDVPALGQARRQLALHAQGAAQRVVQILAVLLARIAHAGGKAHALAGAEQLHHAVLFGQGHAVAQRLQQLLQAFGVHVKDQAGFGHCGIPRGEDETVLID
ncbi:hypothetical protein D3C72_1794120 [compost metagenome]